MSFGILRFYIQHSAFCIPYSPLTAPPLRPGEGARSPSRKQEAGGIEGAKVDVGPAVYHQTNSDNKSEEWENGRRRDDLAGTRRRAL